MFLPRLELHSSSKEAALRRAHVLFRALKLFLIVLQTNNNRAQQNSISARNTALALMEGEKCPDIFQGCFN